jgi:hypothetical protein
MNKVKKINGGVILMGSLYWENEFNAYPNEESKKLGKYRRVWREKNLNTSKTKVIDLPIRYGRCSGKRGDTYTMVLSNEYLNRMGTGLIVPFKNEFENTQQITTQLNRLAKAEDISGNSKKKLAAIWGAIAIWINPNSQYKTQIEKYWNKLIKRDNTEYQEKSFNWNDGSLLNENFILQLDIKCDSDFLLCTYILPKYKNEDRDSQANQNMRQGYPSCIQICAAIKATNYSTYFFENKINSINTFDDLAIFTLINKK